MVHTYNPIIQEVKAGGWGRAKPLPHSKFETHSGYFGSCVKELKSSTREANKQTKPLELYQDHREALGYHTLLGMTAHGFCPLGRHLHPLMRLAAISGENLGWQVLRVGPPLGCQAGSIMQLCLENLSSGELMVFLE